MTRSLLAFFLGAVCVKFFTYLHGKRSVVILGCVHKPLACCFFEFKKIKKIKVRFSMNSFEFKIEKSLRIKIIFCQKKYLFSFHFLSSGRLFFNPLLRIFCKKKTQLSKKKRRKNFFVFIFCRFSNQKIKIFF